MRDDAKRVVEVVSRIGGAGVGTAIVPSLCRGGGRSCWRGWALGMLEKGNEELDEEGRGDGGETGPRDGALLVEGSICEGLRGKV